jgi:CheY-like chemotaxis protein
MGTRYSNASEPLKRSMKCVPNDLPAIALTGYTQTEDGGGAAKAGFVAHLTKPVAAPALIAAIRDVADRQGESLAS